MRHRPTDEFERQALVVALAFNLPCRIRHAGQIVQCNVIDEHPDGSFTVQARSGRPQPEIALQAG